jgi:hypothetical protein
MGVHEQGVLFFETADATSFRQYEAEIPRPTEHGGE